MKFQFPRLFSKASLVKKCSLFVACYVVLGVMCPCALAVAPSALHEPFLPTMPDGIYDFAFDPRIQPNGDPSFSIVNVTSAVLGQTGKWRMRSSDNGNYLYKFTLYNVESDSDGITYISALYAMSDYVQSNAFSYIIREPGDYYLFGYAQDVTTNGTFNCYTSFSVEGVPGVPTVSSRVEDIVGECKRQVSGDYEVALWLHDWIINHAYYDLTYCRHGADSILFDGLGVCDSYSKLYELLLRKAGIEEHRVTGGNHAWNAVCIEGDWCWVDATWDDPAGDTNQVSGQENHYYFGLNDEIMEIRHSLLYSPVVCATLRHCYVGRTGEYQIWVNHIWNTIEEKLRAGLASFDVNTKGKIMANAAGTAYYSISGSTSFGYHGISLAAALMSERSWTFKGNRHVRVHFSYVSSTKYLHGQVITPSIALKLPNVLRTIGVSAFEGDLSLTTVSIPEGCSSIGERAFANCAHMTWISIPASVENIPASAFDGVPKSLIIECVAGSDAESFADANGFAKDVIQP